MRLLPIALLLLSACGRSEPIPETAVQRSLADKPDQTVAKQMKWAEDAANSGEAKPLPKP
ncbi:hypothetical protein [Sphingobium yanoikuyae]|uniref:hypothetical protein n=1 Tax=Sphingobium yanoikuyae TaxID=13690 RepID=UPI0028AD806D|nr:hypothetical protein [Sphingobium yanoikuyae]